MKITKLVHSCLLVEMSAPINRTALFDPGTMSTVDVDSLEYLDDIFITHSHGDHIDLELIKCLVAKFPDVRITTTQEVVDMLAKEEINASAQAPDGVTFFNSPHEPIEPMFPTPPEQGFHYLDKLTHPGDSHTFVETMPILALPIQAPWGASITAMKLALKLRPKYVIPIHDWHWSDEARAAMYDRFEGILGKEDITFIKAVSGESFVLEI